MIIIHEILKVGFYAEGFGIEMPGRARFHLDRKGAYPSHIGVTIPNLLLELKGLLDILCLLKGNTDGEEDIAENPMLFQPVQTVHQSLIGVGMSFVDFSQSIGSNIWRKGDEGFRSGKGFFEGFDKIGSGKSERLEETFHLHPFFPDARKELQYSLSCFILYIATDLDLRGMGFPYFTYLRFLHDLEEEHRMLRRGEVPKNPGLIVSVPTLLDPLLAPPGQHLLKVLVTVPHGYRERWSGASPERYHQIKEEFSQHILQLLELKLIPHLGEHLLFYEAATPLTLERYTGNERGAMYGLASIPQQMGPSRPPHRTPIPGLFQVGHYTRPSHGIVGASLSGLFAVRSILQQLHRA